MKHGNKLNHLSRKSEHRKAMLSNMAASLIMHKRISTTVAKAKALKKYLEPLITKAKEDTTHSRRVVFSYLKHKEPVKELFSVVADKIAERPGGYTRILKTGTRVGDNAETCIMELVDFNENYVLKADKKAARKRTRRGGAKTAAGEVKQTTPKAQDKKLVAKAEEIHEEVAEVVVAEAPEIVAIPEAIETAEIVEEAEVIETTELVEAPEVVEKAEVVETPEATEDTEIIDSKEEEKTEESEEEQKENK
jgi:large subunit ribosomal protein L17